MGDGQARFRAAEERLWRRFGLEPTERFVRLRDGTTVRVQEVGDGPPVVFVHGAVNAGTSWVSLIAELPGFRCIALDRPGCGLSDSAADAPIRGVEQLERFADDLVVDVLDALQLPSAHLGVTSLGGYYGIRSAAAHPDRIDRMVQYSWLVGAPMEKVPLSIRLAEMPGIQSLMKRMPVSRRMLLTMFRQVGLERAIDTGTFDDDMIDWALSVMRDTDTFRNEIESSPQIVTLRSGLNERLLHTDVLLDSVRSPTLFLWGEEDPNGGAAVAESFVDRLPDASLEMIPLAGHAPWIDEPELCGRRTREFLSG